MSRDPFDIPQARPPQAETPSHIRTFYSQLPDMRPTVGRQTPATYACRFDPQNKRVLHVRGYCPHFEGEDAR